MSCPEKKPHLYSEDYRREKYHSQIVGTGEPPKAWSFHYANTIRTAVSKHCNIEKMETIKIISFTFPIK